MDAIIQVVRCFEDPDVHHASGCLDPVRDIEVIESDLVDLPPEEAKAFLEKPGVRESGIGALIRSTYHLLGLRTLLHRGREGSPRLNNSRR